MLNGIDPVIIFEFSKNVNEVGAGKVPVSSSILSKLPLPAIPIYLSAALTGIYIDTEDKSVDIATDIESLIQDPTEATPLINQRTINNTVKVTMIASVDSIGLTLLSALTDVIFPLVTSREYGITYMHGAITVIHGLLHSFNISQQPDSTLYQITMEFIKPGLAQKQLSTQVAGTSGVSLNNGVIPGH